MIGNVSSASGGKKNVAINLIFIFLISLIFPNQAISGNLQQNVGKTQGQPGTTAPLIQVRVVSASAAAEVTVAGIKKEASGVLLNCQATTGQGTNFVQNTGAINLNQPADCFSLKISSGLAGVSPNIQVASASQSHPKIVVLDRKLVISRPSLLPAPFKSQTPSLPLSAFAIGLGLLVGERRLIEKLLKPFKKIKINSTANRLQVLRC